MEAVKEASTTGVRGGAAAFEARPISFRLGAEISGLDLRRSDEIPEETIKSLFRLLGERGILLFRRQGLNHDQHLSVHQ